VSGVGLVAIPNPPPPGSYLWGLASRAGRPPAWERAGAQMIRMEKGERVLPSRLSAPPPPRHDGRMEVSKKAKEYDQAAVHCA
jgi:hypothetical protein